MPRRHSSASPPQLNGSVAKQFTELKEELLKLKIPKTELQRLQHLVSAIEKNVIPKFLNELYLSPPVETKKKHKLRLWKNRADDTEKEKISPVNLHLLQSSLGNSGRADSMSALNEFLENRAAMLDLDTEMKENDLTSSFELLQKRVMKLSIIQENRTVPLACLCGPDDYESEDRYGEPVSAQTISTYPIIQNEMRSGDPICDRFYLQLYRDSAIIALADGCNWGAKPREAAILACNEIVSFMASRINTCIHTCDIGCLLLKALMRAHEKILATHEITYEAGTTTVLAGVLVKLKKPVDGKEWVFVCVSVGDCKSFYYSVKNQTFVEITVGNRMNLTDARDCGGRLGPATGEEGAPDLRNLKTYYALLDENDIVVTVSDGIHDNFDPQLRGMKPTEFSIPVETWEEAEIQYTDLTNKVKSKYLIDTLNETVNHCKGNVTPHDITTSLIALAKDITKACREYMEQTPGARQPVDYSKYPGKMDHTSCVSVRAQEFPFHPFRTIENVISTPLALNEFKKYITKKNLSYPPDLKYSFDQDVEILNFLYGYNLDKGERITGALKFYETYLKSDENELIANNVLDQFSENCNTFLRKATDDFERRVCIMFEQFRMSQWMKYQCFNIEA